MKELTLYQIITDSAEKALGQLGADGTMPAGHNGPYNDPETPVRNSGHWLMLFKKAFEISGNTDFKEGAKKCLDYLMSKSARPMGATFWHRLNPKKDFTNGLVGQAWSIESLIAAYDLFRDDNIIKLAEEVFRLHPYDFKYKGWKIVNVEGSLRGFDYTFNHQLWFAAIGSELISRLGKDDINGVKDFIKAIPTNIQVYRNGVIKHVLPYYLRKSKSEIARGFGTDMRSRLTQYDYLYNKSIGYHGFNLYAIAMIHHNCPSITPINCPKIRRAISVVKTDSFKKRLNNSKYGYPYNPAGIELSYTFDVLADEEESVFWMNEQFNKTYDLNRCKMSDGAVDVNTSSARLYEAVRVRNRTIKLI